MNNALTHALIKTTSHLQSSQIAFNGANVAKMFSRLAKEATTMLV